MIKLENLTASSDSWKKAARSEIEDFFAKSVVEIVKKIPLYNFDRRTVQKHLDQLSESGSGIFEIRDDSVYSIGTNKFIRKKWVELNFYLEALGSKIDLKLDLSTKSLLHTVLRTCSQVKQDFAARLKQILNAELKWNEFFQIKALNSANKVNWTQEAEKFVKEVEEKLCKLEVDITQVDDKMIDELKTRIKKASDASNCRNTFNYRYISRMWIVIYGYSCNATEFRDRIVMLALNPSICEHVISSEKYPKESLVMSKFNGKLNFWYFFWCRMLF